MKLKDKVAMITGSSRGIGRAIAIRFAEEGCNIVINYYQNKRAAKEVEEIIKSMGRNALVVQADISCRKDVQCLIKSTLETLGCIDILVNNTGILQQKPFDQITDYEWDRMLAVCLKGPFICAQEAFPHLKQKREGKIINISSMGGQYGGPKAPHYSAAKAGLISLTKSLARIMAEFGVTVNCISPGFINTDMSSREINELGGIKAVGKNVPLGRIGEPKDIADAALFLASDESCYITGETLCVNGGLHMF